MISPMAENFVVTSIEEYLALPELPIPAVADERQAGRTVRVHKVGFYGALEPEVRRHKLDADFVKDAGRYLLPTTVADDDNGQKRFYRLPLSLSSWAFDAVAAAHALGNPFPCQVEFGILNDRHYAEMI